MAQSAFWQHVPTVHLPEQHFEPDAHCVSVVQAPHWWVVVSQTWPLVQSLVAQQLPGLQLPMQHFSLLPHCESDRQEVQELLVHRPLGQSLFTQQVPEAQTGAPPPSALPPQHLAPVPQSVSRAQVAHLLATQPWPVVQSPGLQQLPVTQVPLQQTAPVPQSVALTHAAHCPWMQA